MMAFYDFLKKMHALFKLKLFTTSNCHLCELAADLISQVIDIDTMQLIEISDDINLLSQYETSIPVLQRIDTLAELKWPFTQHQLQLFLE